MGGKNGGEEKNQEPEKTQTYQAIAQSASAYPFLDARHFWSGPAKARMHF
jgi:hypothetical protein